MLIKEPVTKCAVSVFMLPGKFSKQIRSMFCGFNYKQSGTVLITTCLYSCFYRNYTVSFTM